VGESKKEYCEKDRIVIFARENARILRANGIFGEDRENKRQCNDHPSDVHDATLEYPSLSQALITGSDIGCQGGKQYHM
jgi:hypothetical protein